MPLEDAMKVYGKALEYYMKLAGLEVQGLADCLRVNKSTVYTWIGAKAVPRDLYLLEIDYFLGVNISNIIYLHKERDGRYEKIFRASSICAHN